MKLTWRVENPARIARSSWLMPREALHSLKRGPRAWVGRLTAFAEVDGIVASAGWCKAGLPTITSAVMTRARLSQEWNVGPGGPTILLKGGAKSRGQKPLLELSANLCPDHEHDDRQRQQRPWRNDQTGAKQEPQHRRVD